MHVESMQSLERQLEFYRVRNKQYANLLKTNGGSERRKQTLLVAIASAEAEVAANEAKRQELDRVAQDLDSEIEAKKHSNAVLQNKIGHVHKAFVAKMDAIDMHKQQLASECDSMQQEIDEVQAECDSLSETLDDLPQIKRKMEGRYADIAARVQAAEDDLEAVKARNQVVPIDNGAANVVALEAEAAQLQASIETAEAANQELHKEIKELSVSGRPAPKYPQTKHLKSKGQLVTRVQKSSVS